MHASQYDCLVTRVTYLSDSIIQITFKPNKPFQFAPGQFLSLVVPQGFRAKIKRCYSFALAPEQSKMSGYEICVKLVDNGRGSEFLQSLIVGDRFRILAPYGDFKLKIEAHQDPKHVVLVATGTGIAPFRSMLEQLEKLVHMGKKVHLLAGVRSEDEVLYASEFQKAGVDVRYCVSKPGPNWAGKKGRVTDLLEDLKNQIALKNTDFYLCGNGNMVHSVSAMLIENLGVAKESVISENFAPPIKKVA